MISVSKLCNKTVKSREHLSMLGVFNEEACSANPITSIAVSFHIARAEQLFYSCNSSLIQGNHLSHQH